MDETQNRFKHEVAVRKNEPASRWELVLDDQVIGVNDYQLVDGVYALTHVEVDPDHRGGGMAARLVGASLDDIRAEGARVTPLCPYAAAFLKRHRDYEDLVAD